jgi:poly-gamma-glutamate capsule biosynthesis protein CapA/YwtB (metallophosphatase superfamily)
MNIRRVAIIAILTALIGLLGAQYGRKPVPVVDEVQATASPEASVSAAPTPRATSTATVTLMFGGDIMLGRTVERRILANGDTWPFDSITSTLSNADLTIVNLESPFRTDADQTQSGSLTLRGYPPAIKGITKAGIDAVSLANNHIPDMGIKGLQETEKILDEAKVGRVGAGPTEADAVKPLIVESRGMRIGLLSFTYGVNFDSPGVFYNDVSAERIKTQVESLAPQVDTVIVLCHCGSEYQPLPNDSQKSWAHTAILDTIHMCHSLLRHTKTVQSSTV